MIRICYILPSFYFRYDPKTDTWTMVAPLSMPRDAVGVCLLGDRLYAVGGYDGQTYLNTMESYDPQTNEWTQVRLLQAWVTSHIRIFFHLLPVEEMCTYNHVFSWITLNSKWLIFVHFHVHFIKSLLNHILLCTFLLCILYFNKIYVRKWSLCFSGISILLCHAKGQGLNFNQLKQKIKVEHICSQIFNFALLYR